jgi:hypothetical protein
MTPVDSVPKEEIVNEIQAGPDMTTQSDELHGPGKSDIQPVVTDDEPAPPAEVAAPTTLPEVAKPTTNINSGSERRAEPRYPVHWRAALRIAHHDPIHHGRTLDVSLSGCSVVISSNVRAQQSLTLFLQLPTKISGQTGDVVEVEGQIVRTVLSSQHHGFVVGIAFTQFKADGFARMQSLLRSTPKV